MGVYALLLFIVLLTPSLSMASSAPVVDDVSARNPAAELWREVRQRGTDIRGSTQVKGMDSNVLINAAGEAWRQYRMLTLIPRAGIALLLTLAAVVLFRLIRGQLKLADGFSGKKILRFTFSQRMIHWVVAILFILLALTGCTILFGRSTLIPLMGAENFSYLATLSKTLHDYLGPLFAFFMFLMLLFFIKGNFPSPKLDLQWLLRGGGMFHKHAHADRYNAGEKGWFWISVLVGGVVIVSGFVLDFPLFQTDRPGMEFYHFLHTVSATVLIIASIGHIYMGSVAMEGTLEVMKTGYCDANWAKAHHDVWYEKVKDSAIDETAITATTETAPNNKATV